MKVTVETEEKKQDYPCLMISDNGRVVLFESTKVGTILNGELFNEVGRRSENWSMHSFEKFNGTVTLEND